MSNSCDVFSYISPEQRVPHDTADFVAECRKSRSLIFRSLLWKDCYRQCRGPELIVINHIRSFDRNGSSSKSKSVSPSLLHEKPPQSQFPISGNQNKRKTCKLAEVVQ